MIDNQPSSLDFTGYTPTWCAGCGNWGIGKAVELALKKQQLSPDGVIMLFDIGCSGNMNDFINAYAMHTLHGRALATAVGVKIANHKLPVLVTGGDGALYGEGGNHFLHACRGNHDLTVIVHDNSVYGLTTGQVSPTASKGKKSKSTPSGIIERPVNPLLLALTQGATFVAQGFTAQLPQLAELITAGMQHKGLAIINVLQPCVTFNKENTYAYYIKNTYKLPEDHDKSNFAQALEQAQSVFAERFPLGILYETTRPTYQEELPQLENHSLVKRGQIKNVVELLQQFE
ncbi:MAG: 2-oxoacid:ferredoxin oxidoreductase subunit beta [Candidatus Pacebacteria bacterium]|nr:2-oxoacid:ferredoxin oxidoreductase subunit beta [Candidatus Paceibacterota bacterium]PIR59512.1 MAG: 2-oxoacid ferredoxin oxidoreductase [Candidatus Pacebacteria bacterium CG10_big_fil_rev_8_21_14_0_10_45_6]